MDQQERIEAVAQELRSWNAVALIGAGASLMRGFPLTPQLRPLIWHTIDSHKNIRQRLAIDLHRDPDDDAKSLIGNDVTAIDTAYRLIADSPHARCTFQQGFAQLDSERIKQFSPAHDSLAELLHRRTIETIVSFNWDTLLETAYQRRYGRTLRAGDLWLQKPHGDAANPDQPWVLPHEAGVVPDVLLEHVTALAMQRPRMLLIVGYSERDEEIVTKLIAPLEDRWRVVRIGPRAMGEGDIPLASDQALPAVARAVAPNPEVPGWEYVVYHNQRDLGAALSGQRLGPTDVKACPRLPEVERVKEVLLTVGSATVVGGAGQGKSITVYQAAYDLARSDWEVVRLTDPSRSAIELAAAVSNLPWRTIAIVDDAQALDAAKLQRIIDHASEKLRILVASNHDLPVFGTTIPVAAERAVKVLAEAMLDRKEEVLPLVRRLDDWVGDGLMDESFERRVAAAANSRSPWQFNFILTGGWRRSKDEISILRERYRADQLLGAIAVRQLLLDDGEVEREWLDWAAVELGGNRDWVTQALHVLHQRQTVIGDTAVRCPHVRMAKVVLRALVERSDDPERDNFLRLLRTALQHRTPSLLGIHRLLFEVWYIDYFKLHQVELIDDVLFRGLLRRCWAASEQLDRRDAAWLLATLLRWRKEDQLQELADHTPELRDWIHQAGAVSAPGLAALLNDIYNDDQDLATAILEEINPAAVATWLNDFSLPEAYPITFLVDRMVIAAPQAWKSRVSELLDYPSMLALSEGASPEDAPRLIQLIGVVLPFDHGLAMNMISRATSAIAGALNRSPVDSYHSMEDSLFWHALGGYPSFLNAPKPSKEQRAAARHIVNALDPIAVSRGISFSPRRSWQQAGALLEFVHRARLKQYRKIVNALDFNALDATAGDAWSNFPHELKVLVGALAPYPTFQPARSWIERHTSELRRFGPVLGYVAPNAAASAMRRGAKMDLEIHSGLSWGPATLALHSLSEIDSTLVSRTIRDNRSQLVQGLLLPQQNSCEHLPHFLQVVEATAPGILEEVLTAMDPAVAELNWTARLRGKAAERRAVAALLPMVRRVDGPISEVVERLTARFPRATLSEGATIS